MKKPGYSAIFVPSATVFISSFCIMVLELVASRLTAKHLGSSLYTWTAVIGIVLAGITIGNYIGGRIADRFKVQKALAIIFLLCSASCVVTVVLNNLVGDWVFLWFLSWPARVFSHVAIVFLLPSLLLGTISPVAAKMALDKGLPQGKTVGDIYACGAAGSIAGTFVAGYFLISLIGTTAIIWIVAAALIVMSGFFWLKSPYLKIYASFFIICFCIAASPIKWIRTAGATIGLRGAYDPEVVYQDETQYCYVTVKRSPEDPNRRSFTQDKLVHSEIILGQIDNLLGNYNKILAAVTHGMSNGKEKLSVLFIGGGGYVLPRYIEKHWPGSRNDVVEIDPGVTKAAIAAFGLPVDSPIRTVQMDARNYVDQLIEQERLGKDIPRYDFIYEDAFNDFSVPFQLATKEFNDKIYHILNGDGIYMINMIDVYSSGLFLGSLITTLQQTFVHVQVITDQRHASRRNTFIVIASKAAFDPTVFIEKYNPDFKFWKLNSEEMKTLEQKAGYTVLTDNYAPVETLLAPIVRRNAVDFLFSSLQDEAVDYELLGEYEKAIQIYKKMIPIDPDASALVCNRLGMILAKLGRYEESIAAFKDAISYNENAEYKQDIGLVFYNIGIAYTKIGRIQPAREYMTKAVDEFRKELDQTPDSAAVITHLGNTYAELGNFTQAAYFFEEAVRLEPNNPDNHINLARVLIIEGQYDRAMSGLKKTAAQMGSAGDKKSQLRILRFIGEIERQTKSGYKYAPQLQF